MSANVGYSIDAYGSVSYLGHRVQMAALQDKFFVGDEVLACNIRIMTSGIPIIFVFRNLGMSQ